MCNRQHVDLAMFQQDSTVGRDQHGRIVDSLSGAFGQAGRDVKLRLDGRPAERVAVDARDRLGELGNDPYLYSSTRTPSMLFEGVSFSGL